MKHAVRIFLRKKGHDYKNFVRNSWSENKLQEMLQIISYGPQMFQEAK